DADAPMTIFPTIEITRLYRLTGREPSFVNTCYSMLSPTFGISVAGVYKVVEGKIKEVGGGLSPADAPEFIRLQEATYNESWYQSIMADTFS
ncbi:MAG: FCSD flavin-binding domain-containing protein, partial [Magnetococcales bacterium]|nr:FCSD flavin-binding domain-containing protein [Magnetococcales bacterium]